jgi:hypothetical protein
MAQFVTADVVNAHVAHVRPARDTVLFRPSILGLRRNDVSHAHFTHIMQELFAA